MTYYDSDLAQIHDEGFGQLAAGAADLLIATLNKHGHESGTIVDVGCGSGITAAQLLAAGYDVLGIDLSPAMIEIAKRRVPQATFRVGSFIDAEMPPCVGVCAIGEILNYIGDERNSAALRTALFSRIHAALASGGVFLFDTAGPDRAPAAPTRSFVEHEDWAVLLETSIADNILTREITSFRRVDPAAGDVFRRSRETHRLLLLPPEQIEAELQAAGFQVNRATAYTNTQRWPGLYAFVARK